MSINIVAFSGSLRKGSFTTKLVKALQKAAPDSISLEIIPIGDLPFINQDLEDDLPASVAQFHAKVKDADALLFATPEYNRSYSPVLKNAIDWGSRPRGTNVWATKPAAVIGCSPSRFGALGAGNHLRQVLLSVNTYTMPQPEFYLSEVTKVMDEEGNITDDKTKKFMADFWTAFEKWIGNFR